MQFQQTDILQKEIMILTLIQSLPSLKTPKHKAKHRKHHRITQKHENFWIKKLETLHLRGLNHELDWQISSYAFFQFNLISLLNGYQYQKSAK